jgi:hypothetical protein
MSQTSSSDSSTNTLTKMQQALAHSWDYIKLKYWKTFRANESELVGMDSSLHSIYKDLNDIRDDLRKHFEFNEFEHLKSGQSIDSKQMINYQDKLLKIEQNNYHDGVWGGDLKKGVIPKGQAQIADLYCELHSIIDDLKQVMVEKREVKVERKNMGGIPTYQSRVHDMNTKADNAVRSQLDPSLKPLWVQLMQVKKTIRFFLREWRRLIHDADFQVQLESSQEFLNHLETQYKHDGVWSGDLKKGVIPSGQAIISEVFETSHAILHRLLVLSEEAGSGASLDEIPLTQGGEYQQRAPTGRMQFAPEIDGTLKPVYNQLVAIYNNLLTTSKRTKNFDSMLDRIEQRLIELSNQFSSNGIWHGQGIEGGQVAQGQMIVQELFERTYHLLLDLKDSSQMGTESQSSTSRVVMVDEDAGQISSELMGLYKEMKFIKSKLANFEAKPTLTSSDQRQFLRYAGMLVKLENQYKKEGVWCGDLKMNKIPAGQGVIQDLFEALHDLVRNITVRQEEFSETRKTEGGMSKSTMGSDVSGKQSSFLPSSTFEKNVNISQQDKSKTQNREPSLHV